MEEKSTVLSFTITVTHSTKIVQTNKKLLKRRPWARINTIALNKHSVQGSDKNKALVGKLSLVLCSYISHCLFFPSQLPLAAAALTDEHFRPALPEPELGPAMVLGTEEPNGNYTVPPMGSKGKSPQPVNVV